MNKNSMVADPCDAESLCKDGLLATAQQILMCALDSIRDLTSRLDKTNTRLLGGHAHGPDHSRPDVLMQPGQVNTVVHLAAELCEEIDAAHRAVDCLTAI